MLTIVCASSPGTGLISVLSEVSRRYNKTVELVDRAEFGSRHGWRPNDHLALPALYVGGEGDRSVWVSCDSASYNILDYLSSQAAKY